MRTLKIGFAAIAALGLLVAWTRTGSAAPAPALNQVGRFQVINPTPAIARYTMLLDTATGETWVSCIAPDEGTGGFQAWCPKPRTAIVASESPRP